MTWSAATDEGHPLVVGRELQALVRTYTRERFAWADAAISAGVDDLDRSFRPEQNIHSDPSFAAAQGLPGRIAPGALLLNWISSLLVRHFGLGYIARGALHVKFVDPVVEGDAVAIRLTVRSLDPEADALRCALDVVVESAGRTCVVGDAVARVEPR